MDLSQIICCVCEDPSSVVAQTLSCGHPFCSNCFARYLHGSIDELNRYVRCCQCGNQTMLTYERKRENVIDRFGRDREPKMQHVTGFARRSNGDYVMLDTQKHRIFIFDETSKLVNDFAYLYKYDVQYGITVDLKDRIVFPAITKDSKNAFNTQRYIGLSYYNKNGSPMGFTFLDDNSDIQHLAVTPKNKIIATDAANSKLWFIHELQRVISTKVLEPEIGEEENPKPWGVTVDKTDTYYITDAANHCVKVFEPSGELKFKFGSQGERPGEFNHPTGIAVDDIGRIIVADKHNHRVQMFTDEGIFERFIVRYNSGDDVYMVPVDVECIDNNEVAVLLRGEKDANVSEVRIYPCEGHPDILSC